MPIPKFWQACSSLTGIETIVCPDYCCCYDDIQLLIGTAENVFVLLKFFLIKHDGMQSVTIGTDILIPNYEITIMGDKNLNPCMKSSETYN